jgi:glycosyltransferase involved in cell wall biosynthesis
MPEVWLAIPGDGEALTGGYVYARRLKEALAATDWIPHSVSLPAGFPDPSAEDLERAAHAFGRLPPRAAVLTDGLAYGVLPRSLLESLDQRLIPLVHLPLALEWGLSTQRAAQLHRSEQDALAVARSVVVTSDHMASVLVSGYAVPRARIHVACPGTDRAERARGAGRTPRILTVANVTEGKGLDVLVNALSALRHLSWECRIVGSLARSAGTADKIRKLIDGHDLSQRIILTGVLRGKELDDAYRAADIFALPSRYESYGMAFAEALAHGLPIVACGVGAVPDLVPPDAGILTPVNDPAALADALRRILTNYAYRAQLGEAAWVKGRTLPRWSDTAAKVADALEAGIGA